MKLTSVSDFESLELGTKVYLSKACDIFSYKYAGIAPNCKEPVSSVVMLLSTANHITVDSFSINHEKGANQCFSTDYEEAKETAYQLGVKRLKNFDEIYFDGSKSIKLKLEGPF